MATPVVTSLTTSSSKTSQSTVSTASVTVNAGEMLVVAAAYDDEVLNSVTWNGINLTLLTPQLGAGVRTRIAYLPVTSTASSTVTFTWANAITAKAWAVYKITNVNTVDTETGATGSSTAPSSGNATSSHNISVFFGAIGTEGPSGDTRGTWQNSFTAGQRSGTTGNPAAGNVTIDSGYFIDSTASGITTSAATKTGATSRDWGAALAIFINRSQQFAQSQAKITSITTTQVFAQSRADIKAISRGFGQAMAHVSGQAVLNDTFTRSTSNGWSTPDTGPAWVITAGTASTFSTNGTTGKIILTGAATDTILSTRIDLRDVELQGTFQTSAIPASTFDTVSFPIRSGLSLDFQIKSTGSVDIVLRSVLQTITFPDYIAVSANTNYTFRTKIVNSALGTKLIWIFKIWLTGSSEPEHDGSTPDASPTDLQGGYVGVSVTTVAARTITFDNISARQTILGGFGQAQAKIALEAVTEQSFAQVQTFVARRASTVDDPFTRTASGTLGTASTGGTYTYPYGDDPDSATNGSEAVITSTGTQFNAILPDTAFKNFEARISFKLSGSISVGLVQLLAQDIEFSSDGFGGQVLINGITFEPSALIDSSNVDGTATNYNANEYWTLAVKVYETSAQVNTYTKVWKTSTVEPYWQISNTATVDPNTRAGGPIELVTQSADNITFTLDNFSASDVGFITALGQAQTQIGSLTTYVAEDFSDNQTGTWNVADVGGSWSHAGPQATFNKSGGVGTVSINPAGTGIATLASVSAADQDGYLTFAASDFTGTTTGVFTRIEVRCDASFLNYYRFEARFYPNGSLDVLIRKFVAGSNSTLRTDSSVLTGISTNDRIRIRWQVQNSGSDVNLRYKIWNITTGQSEPASFSTDYTDVAPGSTYTGAGAFQLTSQVTADFTGSFPIIYTYDDLNVTSISVLPPITAGFGQAQAKVQTSGGGGGGTLTFVQTNSGIATTGNVSSSSWAPTNGNLLVAGVLTRTTSITASVSGNGQTWNGAPHGDKVADRGQDRLQVFYCIASSPSAGAVTATLTGNTNPAEILLIEISGADATTPIEADSIIGTGGTDNANPSGSVTTLTDNAWILAVFQQRVRTITLDGSLTSDIEDVDSGGAAGANVIGTIAHKTVTPAGSATASGTLNNTSDWVVWTGAIRPGAAGATSRQAFAQTNADIKAIGRGFAQANGDIKQISRGFAQTQSDIKAIGRGFAQTQADIKQIGRGFAQAQADIKQTSKQFAQTQSDIKAIGRVFSQSQADIKATNFGFSQTQSTIRGNVFSQTQADVRATYQGFGQTQTDVKSISYSLAQANADIKAVSSRFAQANADIKSTGRGFAQSNADIKTIANVFGQAQADIKQISRGSAQSNADIKATSRGFGQTQSDIKQFGQGFGQSNTDIKSTIVGAVGQSQADILTVGKASGQTQADIKAISIGYGQTLADIKTSSTGFGQTNANITTTYQRFAQSAGRIKGIGVIVLAQTQAIIRTTYLVYAQSLADIKQTYPRGGGSIALTTFYLHDALSNDTGILPDSTFHFWTPTATAGTGYGDNRSMDGAVGQSQVEHSTTDTLSSGTTYRVLRFISEPLSAQTISGSVLFHIATKSDSASLVSTIAQISIWRPSDGTKVGDLARPSASDTNTDGTEQALTSNTATITDLAVADGDIIVVEFYAQPNFTLAVNYSLYYDGTTEDSTTSNAALIRFSDPISLLTGVIQGPTFGQAQAKISQTYQVFAQSNADIKSVSKVFSQAQATIRGNAFAQTRANIRQTYQGHANVNAIVRAVYNVFANARADIKATSQGSGQTQADTKQAYDAYASVQGEIKQTYAQFAQNQTLIRQTYLVFANTQSTIKSTYNQFANANADIHATINAFAQAQATVRGNRFGQTQADIVATYQGYAGTQADIKGTVYRFAQAQAKLRSFGFKQYAQAQGNIRFNGNAETGQAQAKIHAFGVQDYGQTQSDIKHIYVVFAQAQSTIKATVNGFAQAQATVQGNVFAQTQGEIKQTYKSYGQANAYVLLVQRGYAQTQSDIRAISNEFAQAQATIRGNAFGQTQSNIRQTYLGFANTQSEIKAVSNVCANAQGTIKQIYSVYGQAQAEIKAINTAFANTQANIKSTYQGYAQTQATIKATSNGHAQTQTEIKATGFAFAQTQAKINAFGVQTFAQAQGNIRFAGTVGVGQTQAKIRSFGQIICGQSQAEIKTTYKVFAQAQADIRAIENAFGNAQSAIKKVGQGYGQVNTSILGAIQEFAQSNADILATQKQYANTIANIRQTYQSYGQTQAYVKVTNNVTFAQAQTTIRGNAHAQTNADILAIYIDNANAQALIRTTVNYVAQASADIRQRYLASANVLAQIVAGTIGFGQAQAHILIAGAVVNAQANALIIKAYGSGQAQAEIFQPHILKSLTILDTSLINLGLKDIENINISETENPLGLSILDRSIIGLTIVDTEKDGLTLLDRDYE